MASLQMGVREGSQMSPSWRRVALNPITGGLVRDGRGDTDTEEKPREGGGRDRRDAAKSPGAPGAPEAGRGWKDPPLEPQEGKQPCLDLRGPAPPGSQWPWPAWISVALPGSQGSCPSWISAALPCLDLSGPALRGSQWSCPS